MYAVYMTIYKGTRLPPFYIGHAKLENIKNGYLGSVSSKMYKDIWTEEIMNNRHLFKIKVLRVFKTKSEALQNEEFVQRQLNVHTNDLYINKSIVNKKFQCTDFSHIKPHTSRTKALIRQKTIEQFKDPVKRKRHYDAFLENNGNHKDKIWINDGVVNKRVTEQIYNEKFSSWNRGRLILGNKFWEHSTAKNHRDDKTGRFLKQKD